MNIYKYGLTQNKVIYVLECPVLQEKNPLRDGRLKYEIQEEYPGYKKKSWIYADELEVMSNKRMYSLSGDNKDKYVEALKEACKNTADNYLKKSQEALAMLSEILRINNL